MTGIAAGTAIPTLARSARSARSCGMTGVAGRLRRRACGLTASIVVLLAAPLGAQDSTAADSARRAENARLDSVAAERFFADETPIAVTIVANLGRLRRDTQEDAPWRAATLRWEEAGGAGAELAVRLRTRGIWRLRNCHFPPLRLDLPRGAARETRFGGLNRPKLVTHCRDDDDRGDEYLLRELQVYRMQRLLTPFSHRARLLRATWVDSASGRAATTRWAILLEEPDALARRVGGHLVESQGAMADDLDSLSSAIAGLFQYMIGNTDWSVAALHNVELVATTGLLHPVPYDFDFSGMVEAFYAAPPPQLPIRSVRDRLYRGFCTTDDVLARAIARFQEQRPAIEALYADEIGRLLSRRSTSRALEYLADFYRTIGDPRRLQREIVSVCQGRNGD
jgi:hypothetical protein